MLGERNMIVVIGKAAQEQKKKRKRKKIIVEHVNGVDAGAPVAAHREDFLHGIGAF